MGPLPIFCFFKCVKRKHLTTMWNSPFHNWGIKLYTASVNLWGIVWSCILPVFPALSALRNYHYLAEDRWSILICNIVPKNVHWGWERVKCRLSPYFLSRNEWTSTLFKKKLNGRMVTKLIFLYWLIQRKAWQTPAKFFFVLKTKIFFFSQKI